MEKDHLGQSPNCPHCTKPQVRPFPKPKPERNTQGPRLPSDVPVLDLYYWDDYVTPALLRWLQPNEHLEQGTGVASRWIFFVPDGRGLLIGRGRRPGFCMDCSGRFNLDTMEMEHLLWCKTE